MPGNGLFILLCLVVTTGTTGQANVEVKPKANDGPWFTSSTSWNVSHFDHSLYVFVLASRGGTRALTLGGGASLPGEGGVAGVSRSLSVVPVPLETCPAVGES